MAGDLISLRLTGDDAVVVGLRKAGELRARAVRQEMERLGRTLQTLVKRKLSDDVLHVRTGTLRRSIVFNLSGEDTALVGTVGTNVKYARVHEFGFHETVQVREHLRRDKAQMRRALRGKRQGPREAGATVVRAHEMRMNLPERSFLRSALREMEDEIRRGLARAGSAA